MQETVYEENMLYQQEDEKAVLCALTQAAIDRAERAVIAARISSRSDPHMLPHWYVRVTMHSHAGESLQAQVQQTHVLYRVWSVEGAWKASHVGSILPKRARDL